MLVEQIRNDAGLGEAALGEGCYRGISGRVSESRPRFCSHEREQG